jgi:putative membrane protein
MKGTKIMLGALIAISAFISACDDKEEKKAVQEPDRTFAADAAQGNLVQIQLGGIAVSKATDTKVRVYAQMMINDHQTSLNELTSISTDRDLTLPADVTTTQQALKVRLQALEGYQFDTAYMHSQVRMHQTTSALFQEEAALGKESRFKSYASKYLPKINAHWSEGSTISTELDAQ